MPPPSTTARAVSPSVLATRTSVLASPARRCIRSDWTGWQNRMTGCQSGCTNSRRRSALSAYPAPPPLNSRKGLAGQSESALPSLELCHLGHDLSEEPEKWLQVGKLSWDLSGVSSAQLQTRGASQYATPPSIRCIDSGMTKAGAYFTAMAPTRDSKILNPSVPPNSGSLERSGWGIIPNTFRPGLQIPATFSSDPFGL